MEFLIKNSRKKVDNLEGKIFSWLSVIKRDYTYDTKKGVYWVCQCKCGNIKSIQASALRDGRTFSCGCLRKQRVLIDGINYRTDKNSKKSSSEYIAYRNMINRCYKVKNKAYKYYGGRGIKVCSRWLSKDGFINFILDMGLKPSPRLSLDRYPNNENGIYEKTNCRWADNKQQSNNRRTNRWIEYNGKNQTLSKWSEDLDVEPAQIAMMLKRKIFEDVYNFYSRNKCI